LGLAYRGEDKKAPAAAWTVLVSRSRNGMIFPVTRAPSFSRAPIGCSSFGLGGSRGDGLWRSLVKGHNDTTAPGFPGAADRLQGDAPQSAG